MSFIKKSLAALALSTLALSALANEKLVVAASPTPHAEILEFVKPYLKEKGVDLEIKVFSDYILPNKVLLDGQADANYFQHVPYLNAYNRDNKTNIAAGVAVHLEPFAIYSKKYKNLDEVKDGAIVAIPNDPSNTARALLILQTNGLIKLKNPTNIQATERDVVSNPKHLKIKSFDAAILPRVLADVDLDLITANFAIKAGLNPLKDSLAYEQSGPYENIISYLPQNKDLKKIKLLEEALTREEVRQFILNKYNGSIVPAIKK